MIQTAVIKRFCHVPCGAAGVNFLTVMNLSDRMDSFYLRFVFVFNLSFKQYHFNCLCYNSETLKYLYLLFDEDNEFNTGYVFNTEAHPFPLYSPLYKGLLHFE